MRPALSIITTAALVAAVAVHPASAKVKYEGGASNWNTGSSKGKTVLLSPTCSLSSGCLFTGNDKSATDIGSAYEAVFATNDLSLALEQRVEGLGQSYSGTWSTPVAVSFFSVKAGNQFMLYSLDAPTTSGSWSTAGLVNAQGVAHAVSHLSFWTGTVTQRPSTPTLPSIIEPPTRPETPPSGGPLPEIVPPFDTGEQGLPELPGLGAAVPEPATWISMILGFGLLGAELRRRRRAAVIA